MCDCSDSHWYDQSQHPSLLQPWREWFDERFQTVLTACKYIWWQYLTIASPPQRYHTAQSHTQDTPRWPVQQAKVVVVLQSWNIKTFVWTVMKEKPNLLSPRTGQQTVHFQTFQLMFEGGCKDWKEGPALLGNELRRSVWVDLTINRKMYSLT